jgi:hypothetical protein
MSQSPIAAFAALLRHFKPNLFTRAAKLRPKILGVRPHTENKDSVKQMIGNHVFRSVQEIARIVVESQRPSELIGYATSAPFAIDFLETALAIEDSSKGIWRWPMTLRNCRSATSSPEPTQRSM